MNFSNALVGYPYIDTFPIDYITSSFSYNGDFLQFSSRTSFDYTMDELKRLDGLLITPDSLQDSVGINPILERFDSKFSGFFSLRKKIENEIDSLSQANVYNPSVYDPDDHFIGDLIYRTVINNLMEVQISEKVYKVINKEWVAEFQANNPSLLSFVRSYSVSNLNGTIQDTIINTIKYTYTGSEYELDAQGGFKRGKNPNCGMNIANIVYKPNGEVNFHIDPVLCGSGVFVVDFGDGSTSAPLNAWSYYTVLTSQTYLINGKYLAKITFDCDCGSTNTDKLVEITITNAASSNCQNFPTADFDIDLSIAGKLKLAATNPNSNLKYHWKITNPFEENNDENESTYETNYPNEITVEVCLKIYNTSGCVSTKCSTITIPNGCCQRGHTQVLKEVYYNSQNNMIKCKIFRWNGGPLGRNVGAKSVNFEYRKRKFSIRKNPNNHWIRTKIEIGTSLFGDCWAGDKKAEDDRKIGPCKKIFNVNKSENKNSRANADVTYNPGDYDAYKRVYTKKNRLNSTHYVKYNGQIYSSNLALTKCN